MGEQNTWIFVALALVIILCAWWHTRDNRQFADAVKSKMDPESAQWLIRFAWSRTVQLLVAITCGSILILSYQWELNDIRNDLNALTDAVEQKQLIDKKRDEDLQKAAIRQQKPNTPAAANVANIPGINHVPVPSSLANSAPSPNQPTPPNQLITASSTPVYAHQPAQPYNPPPAVLAAPAATQSSPNQAAVPQPLPPGEGQGTVDNNAPITAQNNVQQPAAGAIPNTVEDVYNPERNSSDDQSSMDDIKKRYEDILVIYMFLKKCGKVKPTDYNTITSALSQEMASVNAPGRLQYDILTSAQGSYKEIYSQSPCDGAGIAALNNQYNEYIRVLSTNFPPQ